MRIKAPNNIPAYYTEAAAHADYEIASLLEWILDPEIFGMAMPDEVLSKAVRVKQARERLEAAHTKLAQSYALDLREKLPEE